MERSFRMGDSHVGNIAYLAWPCRGIRLPSILSLETLKGAPLLLADISPDWHEVRLELIKFLRPLRFLNILIRDERS